jgi:hypothetical protein
MNESVESTKHPETPAECAEKWRPLTKGIDDPGAEEKSAWVFEQEVRFLSDTLSEEERASFGIRLKFIFPLLRRIAPQYADAEQFDRDEVVERFKTAFAEMIEPHPCSCVVYDEPTPEEVADLVEPAAERMITALKSFPNS